MWMIRCVVGCALIALAAATAQPLRVTLQLPFANNMPPRIAEWMENEQLIGVLVVNTDGKNRYDDLTVSVLLEKDGRVVARSKDGHPSQPRWSIAPGESRQLSWREVVSLAALDYDRGLSQQMLTTGELPEGEYRLCMRVLQLGRIGTPAGTPMSPDACAPFAVRSCCPMPIALVNPAEGATVSAPPLLQWSPCQPPTAAPPLRYRVVVVPMWQVASPQDALRQNPPTIDEFTIGVPQYQVSPVQWNALLTDATQPMYAGHVWQVTPYQGERPCGKPSPIGMFRVKPGSQVPRDSFLVSVLEWEVPYEELLMGRPVKLTGQIPADATDTLLYVLRLRMPKTLSPQQIAQLLGQQPAPSDTLQVQEKRNGSSSMRITRLLGASGEVELVGSESVRSISVAVDTAVENNSPSKNRIMLVKIGVASDDMSQPSGTTTRGFIGASKTGTVPTFSKGYATTRISKGSVGSSQNTRDSLGEAGGVSPGVYYIYAMPSDTVEQDTLIAEQGHVLLSGTFRPQHLLLPLRRLFIAMSGDANGAFDDVALRRRHVERIDGEDMIITEGESVSRKRMNAENAVSEVSHGSAVSRKQRGLGEAIAASITASVLARLRLQTLEQQENVTTSWVSAPGDRTVAVTGSLDEEGNVVFCWFGRKNPDGRTDTKTKVLSIDQLKIDAMVQLVR